jgi:hypothetical protein
MSPGTPSRSIPSTSLVLRVVWLLGGLVSACVPAERDNTPPEDVVTVQDTKAPPGDTAVDGGQPVTVDVGGVDTPEQDVPTAEVDAVPLAQGCGTDTDCQGLPAPPCQRVGCNAKGLCILQPADDGLPCGGNACIGDGKCLGGQCNGTAVACDDSNACTVDSCHPVLGCLHAFADDGTQCDDGKLCTSFGVKDGCKAGVCTGKPVVCDDGNPCTLNEKCNPATGACNGDPAPTGSKVPCTGNDIACQGPGFCEGKTCVHVKACDDGNPCTADFCTGAVGSGPEGCVHKMLVGGSKCSTDLCVNSQCVLGGDGVAKCVTTPTCSNDNVCNPLSGCDAKTGLCSYDIVPDSAKLPCDDKDPCTTGTVCTKKQCKGATIGCDDANPCTIDPACTPGLGCTHKPTDGPCNDGSACTSKDTCSGGVCVGQATSCDDGNPCTTDTCAMASGCVHEASADGTACASGKTCQNGTCAGKP